MRKNEKPLPPALSLERELNNHLLTSPEGKSPHLTSPLGEGA